MLLQTRLMTMVRKATETTLKFVSVVEDAEIVRMCDTWARLCLRPEIGQRSSSSGRAHGLSTEAQVMLIRCHFLYAGDRRPGVARAV